jgi:hypothetical protein
MAKDSRQEPANRLPWTRRFKALPDEQPNAWEEPRGPRRGLQLGRVDGAYRKLTRRQLIAVIGFPLVFIVLIVIGAILSRPPA